MERRAYGSTGEIGVDGILTPELARRLDRMQRETVRQGFIRLDAHQPGDLFPMAADFTQSDLRETFIGGLKRVTLAFNEIIGELREENQDWVAIRRRSMSKVTVLTSMEAFVILLYKMQERGIGARTDIEEE